MKKYIKHKGIVIDKSSPTQYAVKILQQSACATCHAASLCSASESKEKIIDAFSHDDIPMGTEVTVYGEASMGYKALTWAVITPLIIVLVALLLTSHYIDSELISGIIALIMLIPYYGILAMMRKKLQQTFVFYIKP